jgi:hypothetical protein
MSLSEFCEHYQVDVRTTWRWAKEPGVEDKIKARLEEIAPRARTIAAWNRLLLIGLSSLGKGQQHGDQRAAVDALKTYLGHFGEMKLPVQRQDVKVTNNLAEIFSKAEKEYIEGQVVEVSDADKVYNTTESSNL